MLTALTAPVIVVGSRCRSLLGSKRKRKQYRKKESLKATHLTNDKCNSITTIGLHFEQC